MELFKQLDVSTVLLDITLLGESRLDVVSKELRQKYPQIPVLIPSFHPEQRFAVRALRAGAAGYITKQSAPEELVLAIRKIVSGGKCVSASLAETLAAELDNASGKFPTRRSLTVGLKCCI